MSEMPTTVEKRIHLSTERADRLSHLAQSHQISEDRIIERALDILFSLTELFDERAERQGWSFLSEPSLQRVWDNDEDAIYIGLLTPSDLSEIDQRLHRALEL
jgi:predicted transcriptional regulator